MASRSRIFLAFIAGGLTTLLGVMLSSVVQALIRRDNSYAVGIAIVPLFGFPFVIAVMIGASLVYLVAKRAGVITRRFTIVTGAVLGAAIGHAARMPMMPVWSAMLIGAAAASVWWRVARLDQSIPPAA